MADVEVADGVVAESVAVVEEVQVSRPVVRMPSVYYYYYYYISLSL